MGGGWGGGGGGGGGGRRGGGGGGGVGGWDSRSCPCFLKSKTSDYLIFLPCNGMVGIFGESFRLF